MLDDGVSFADEFQHVAAEKKHFGKRPEDGKGSGDAEEILHLGCAGGEGAEDVIGLHGTEDSLRHGDLEVGGWFDSGDFAGEVLPGAEVLGAPGDLVGEVGEARGQTANREGLLSGVDVG